MDRLVRESVRSLQQRVLLASSDQQLTPPHGADSGRPRCVQGALGNDAAAPPTCTPEVARQVTQQHLDSPAVLAIFPIQDIMAVSPDFAPRPPDQINDPTNPQHYWRYRVHRRLEELSQHQLCFDFREMVYQAGRHIQGPV
jgi:hypothetical protein